MWSISSPKGYGIVFAESINSTSFKKASAELLRSNRILREASIFVITRGSISFVILGRVGL
jgi:hypothetical protein